MLALCGMYFKDSPTQGQLAITYEKKRHKKTSEAARWLSRVMVAHSHKHASPLNLRKETGDVTDAGQIALCMTGRCSVTLLRAEAEEQTKVLLGAVIALHLRATLFFLLLLGTLLYVKYSSEISEKSISELRLHSILQ